MDKIQSVIHFIATNWKEIAVVITGIWTIVQEIRHQIQASKV